MNGSQTSERSNALLLRAAMFASAGAAAIHLAAAHSHLLEWPAAGNFMIWSGSFQLAWIAWVAQSPSRRALAVGAIGNAAIAGLWIVSRTVGLPMGPMPWKPESAHSPDILATVLEALIVVAAIGLLRSTFPRPARRLMILAIAGVPLSVAATSHDPTRERAVALAALALTGAATVVFHTLIKLMDRVPVRPAQLTHIRSIHRAPGRDHAEAPNIRTAAFVLDDRSGIAILARG
ncbi:MAG: hypothetical protein NVSMB57_06630 [Actinomycetota bacterium]